MGHRVVPSCCSALFCLGSDCPGRIRQSVHRAVFQRLALSPAAADSNTCPGGRFVVSVRLDANRIGRACLRPPVSNAARDSLTIAGRIGCCGIFAECLPMLGGGGSVGRLRLDYLCVLAVASCYQRRPLRLPAILQWMPGGVVPTLSADAGGAPKNGFRPAAPASARCHGLRCQRTPGGVCNVSALPPPCNSQSRQIWHFVQNILCGAYCTRPAAFWNLPMIELLQRLGLALGRLRGRGLLPGLALPLLLPLLMCLSCTPGGCGSCVGLLLLLQQGRGDATEPIRPPNGHGRGGRGDFIGLSTNGNEQERAPRSTPPRPATYT